MTLLGLLPQYALTGKTVFPPATGDRRPATGDRRPATGGAVGGRG
ncbi:hypothetical protein AB0G29_04145 [Streptomyces parvus]